MKKLILLSARLVPFVAAVTFAVVPGARATNWQVTMEPDDRFHPDTLTVALGDSVTWTNNDADDHSSTSGLGCTPDGDWDSGALSPGASFTYVTDAVEVLPYHCMFHCAMGMVGLLTVTQATPTQEDTWGTIKSLYRE